MNDAQGKVASLLQRLLAIIRGPAPVYLVASVLARLGSILLIPLYTRRLSPSEYGDFALAQSIIGFLPVLFTLGLISALPKFYFSEPDRAAARSSAGTVALWLALSTTLLTLLSCIGVLIAAPGGDGGLLHRYELTCICVAAAGSALSTVPDSIYRSEQRPYRAAAYQLTQFALQLTTGLVFVLWLGRGLRGAIEATALGYAITGLLSISFIVVALKGRLNTSVLRTALLFASPFIPHFIAYWVQTSADRWTMKAFHLEDELGGFVLALQLTAPIGMALVAWNDVDTARLGEISRSGGVPAMARHASRLRLRYFLVGSLVAIGLLASLPILGLLVGSRFVPALRLSPLLAATIIIDGLFYPNSNILYYTSRTRAIALTTMLAAALSIVFSIAFVPLLGAWGAILARLLTATTRTTVMWRLANRLLRDESDEAPKGS
ncbi:MAG: lipopolysaccharide biosynthesis protein [Labilithrix sp.]|nr:lipopolysaccharide biosynthesis protein [Labilithrix sp.]